MAIVINQITRMASLLLRVVESSLGVISIGLHDKNFAVAESLEVGAAGGKRMRTMSEEDHSAESGSEATMQSETAKLRVVHLSDRDNPIRELIDAANATVAEVQNNMFTSNWNKNSKVHPQYLRLGDSLDLLKIIQSEGEIKLVMLVLMGHLQVNEFSSDRFGRYRGWISSSDQIIIAR